MKAVILAAGTGSRLAPLTNDRPKVLVEVRGRPILFRQLDWLAAAGIPSRDVVIVGGYMIDVLRAALTNGGYGDCTVVLNDRYEPWNNFWSLATGLAEPAVSGHDVLQFDGDVILDEQILPRMIAAGGEALLAVDRRADLDDETMKVELEADGVRVHALSKQLPPAGCAGEYIGISRLSAGVARLVLAELRCLRDEALTGEYYEYAYYRLLSRAQVTFGIVDVHDCTVIEIDNLADLARAEALVAGADPEGGRA